MSEVVGCPKCGTKDVAAWTVRRIQHSGERALECPSCGSVITEQFIRDVWGMDWPASDAPVSLGEWVTP